MNFSEWEEFQRRIINIVDRQDEDKVEFKPYAQTYARHIMKNLKNGLVMGYSAAEATRIQLLYIVSNLEGTSEKDLKEIQTLALKKGIDIAVDVSGTLSGRDYDN